MLTGKTLAGKLRKILYQHLKSNVNTINYDVSDENPLSFYPGIKDGSKLNLLVIKKAEEGSSEGRASHSKSGTHLLRDEISRVLRHYYTESETESIINELIKDLKNKVNNLSYDDLERLATALLQDQENIA